MADKTKYNIPVFLVLMIISAALFTACNTFDTDFERNNPNDPLLPKIEIISPENKSVSHHMDSIFIEIKVIDLNTSPEDLEINLFSSADGFLKSMRANSLGFASVSLFDLSNNVHYIKAEVMNQLNYTQTDSVLLYNNAPPAANIIEAKLVDNYFTVLDWNRSTDSDFESYKVYRVNSSGETLLITEIYDINKTTFHDVTPLDTVSRYYINTSSSFYETENSGRSGSVYRHLFAKPRMVLKYPGEPVLLLKQGSYPSSKLMGFNYEQNKIVAELPEGEYIYTSTVGDNGFGVEIYVVYHSDRTVLHIYDGSSLQLKKSVKTDYHIDGIETDNKGNIITRDYFWFRASTRAQFPYHRSYIQASLGVFKISKTTNDIYIINNDWSPSSMWHIKYDDDNGVLESTKWPYHGGPSISGSAFQVHPHGKYVVSSIYGNIFDKAPSQQLLKTLNQIGRYIDFAFNESGDFLYAADQRGWVNIYNDLTFIRRIEVDMIPQFIFYENGQLVLFGESTVLKNYFGVLVLPETVLN
jgi:hypothetical protein